uniref:Bm14251 n=1 Tax=Brugia malayi TaxID=6279 RepID=A0A1I9G6S4_BRUMA|nr:Bm14251 [Brugia malayi]
MIRHIRQFRLFIEFKPILSLISDVVIAPFSSILLINTRSANFSTGNRNQRNF